jgi:hypothetical protein
MSKTLRRPMFRGGRVDSRGTGITSGLDDSGYADGGRVGFQVGGGLFSSGPYNPYGSYNPFSPISEIAMNTNPIINRNITPLQRRNEAISSGKVFDIFAPTERQTYEANRPRTSRQFEEAIQKGLDITRSKPFEISDESIAPRKSILETTNNNGDNIPTELTEDDELTKQAKLYQKLLGGDEAKSQAIFDALLAASPAFFKGKNLKEAAPEVLTAINKSGAFDKPRDIKQAAAQLAIQRAMLRDKAVAEEKSRLAIYGAKNVETLSETLKNIPGSFIAGPLPEGFKENPNLLRPGGIYSVGDQKFYAVPGDVVDSSGKKKPGVVGLQKL